MTKAELVEEVARAAELNKRDAEVIVETVFDSIISTLHKGEKVELRGFGSFRTRERGPRRGRNPKTGAPVDVPAKRVPYFKPGKELKEFFTEEPAGEDQNGGAPDEQASVAASSAAQPEQSVGHSGGSPAGEQAQASPAESAPSTTDSSAGSSSQTQSEPSAGDKDGGTEAAH